MIRLPENSSSQYEVTTIDEANGFISSLHISLITFNDGASKRTIPPLSKNTHIFWDESK